VASGIGWSPGPARWKDDLTPISAADWNFDRAAHLLAHAGFGGTPADHEALVALGPERAVRSLVQYERIPNPRLQPFVESGLWDPLVERLSRQPARSDRPGAEARQLDGCGQQAGRQSSGAAGLRPVLLLAPRHDARDETSRLLVGEPDACRPRTRCRRRWPCSGTATSPRTRTRCATTGRCCSRSSCSSRPRPATCATWRSRSRRTRRCSTSSTRSTTSRGPRTRTSRVR
jgi:hypothetical protein